MKRFVCGLAAFVAGAALIASPAAATPPAKDGKDGKFGPRGPRIGTVLPPFLVEELNLSDAQKAQLAEIEKDVKAKLDKLLTDEQKKTLEEFRPGPGGERGGKGDGKGRKGPPPGGKGKGEPPPVTE